MAERPDAEVLVIGGHGTSYGAPPPHDASWKSTFLAEVAGHVDIGRIHFTGHLPYRDYLRALQISSAHVYLTYPFVLSWSLMNALACGATVLASDTAPVREMIKDGVNGLLTDFFDVEAMADRMEEVLDQPQEHQHLGKNGAEMIRENYSLEACLPRMVHLYLDAVTVRGVRTRETGGATG